MLEREKPEESWGSGFCRDDLLSYTDDQKLGARNWYP
ncbi:hypothetical protein Thiowin_02823 [Thiorhodovibrio winogradskyi]|uniref:Uncharacterized protein n=1 Tax=Thiorhodovibrio winogradskyi TaxID=77007 RepID=A0ABZ0S9S3_9GAMM